LGEKVKEGKGRSKREEHIGQRKRNRRPGEPREGEHENWEGDRKDE
jgi:hypothetical protein